MTEGRVRCQDAWLRKHYWVDSGLRSIAHIPHGRTQPTFCSELSPRMCMHPRPNIKTKLKTLKILVSEYDDNHLRVDMLHNWEDIENVLLSEGVGLSRCRATIELVFLQQDLYARFKAKGSEEGNPLNSIDRKSWIQGLLNVVWESEPVVGGDVLLYLFPQCRRGECRPFGSI